MDSVSTACTRRRVRRGDAGAVRQLGGRRGAARQGERHLLRPCTRCMCWIMSARTSRYAGRWTCRVRRRAISRSSQPAAPNRRRNWRRESADGLYAGQPDIERARAYYASVKATAGEIRPVARRSEDHARHHALRRTYLAGGAGQVRHDAVPGRASARPRSARGEQLSRLYRLRSRWPGARPADAGWTQQRIHHRDGAARAHGESDDPPALRTGVGGLLASRCGRHAES